MLQKSSLRLERRALVARWLAPILVMGDIVVAVYFTRSDTKFVSLVVMTWVAGASGLYSWILRYTRWSWQSAILNHDVVINGTEVAMPIQAWLADATKTHSEICLMRTNLTRSRRSRPVCSLIWAGYGSYDDGVWFLVQQS
jgi:hypothetical protein